ncbi:MAG: hypothetical protein IT335_03495 [Thermomicrobiales bacterium]|nr:hypothetical protein [Thermomicrobiales bacterium]
MPLAGQAPVWNSKHASVSDSSVSECRFWMITWTFGSGVVVVVVVTQMCDSCAGPISPLGASTQI